MLAITLVVCWTHTASADGLLIENARMFGDDASAPQVSLLVRDGKIADIGTTLKDFPNAIVIDAQGRIVTPALMNSASQLGLIELHSIPETVDSNGSSSGLGPEFDVQFGINQNSTLIDIAKSEGLARVAVLPSGSDKRHFSGLGALLHLRESPNMLDRPHAMLVIETGGSGSGTSSRSATWVAIRQEFDEAKEDFKEFHAHEDDLDEDEAILHDVLNRSLPLVIKASRESDIAQAISLAKDLNIRVVIFGGEEAWRLAPELANAEIPVIIIPYANLPSVYDALGTRADNAKILHEAGVLIGFSVDSIFVSHNAGNAMRVGAGIAAGHGLDKQAALDAITKNPAQIWGISDEYGTLEKGKAADIVIWSGDPLEALSSPDTVIIDGKLIEDSSRHKVLREKYRPTQLNVVDGSIQNPSPEQEP